MNSKVFIRIKDKETKQKSKEIPIEDLIYNQNEIEFIFGNYEDDDYATLPYKDFLFYQEDYEVEIIDKIKEKKIPKKLPTWFSVEVKQCDEENIDYANYNFETMYKKINEICDYLKSKGE